MSAYFKLISSLKRVTITEDENNAASTDFKVQLLIVACDGLWKTFDNEEAIKFALDKVTEFEKSDIAEELGERREQTVWRLAAESMAAEAVKRKCGDNVSVLLLPLSPYISIA
ncbi:hypothetical protein WR25_16964 [Diploscapter pachys]|uniref:PPM-type phosphatase domain-containing protein n=1 Tax=Diploscapter pachys TaxID=2018661 RepID=A0A2A2KRU4_9BILA|nr:hypothetical protein WR25_16964 [Diploscapter pachys]